MSRQVLARSRLDGMSGGDIFSRSLDVSEQNLLVRKVMAGHKASGVANDLTIANLEDSDVITSAPWFMVTSVVLRPVK